MAKAAFGTTFSHNGQVVAGLTKIGGIEIKVDKVDSTTHQSTGNYKEFIPILLDAGDVPIEGLFDPTDTNGQLAMMTDMNALTMRSEVITFPGGIATWTFNAYITGLKVAGEANVDGLLPFSATVSITGKPVFATTASNNVTALTVTTAVLFPTFAQGTYVYRGTTTAASLTFTPTFAAGTCTITNGTQTVVTTSTVASGSLALNSVGNYTDFTMTIQETNKTPKVYTFSICKTA